MSTPVNPLVGQPNLAQQAAQATPPNAPVPAAMQAPINMPSPAAPPTMPSQPQPQVVKGPSPWQRAVHALLGSQTEYQQTPNGPVPIQVQNKPGQLFRSILAGAILGAGAGTANAEHNAGSGWGAAGAGAQADAQNVQKQQELKQQQAQQQFENQRQVDQDKQEELVRKAQIAQANAETLRMNKEIQGMDFDQHQKMAAFGKAGIQPYVDANLKPMADNISESQHQQFLIDHPESSSWDWEPTGVKLTMAKDASGNETPHYEATYTAYDPKGKVTVPASVLKEWENNGVFDRFPEYKSVLTNKTLPALDYARVKAYANGVYADNLAKQKDQLEIKKDQAAIDADNARRVEAVTGTRKINQEISEAALGKTQADQFNKALDELNKTHGNFDALPPSSRVILAESMNRMIPALAASYKDAIAADPTDSQGKAADFLSQIQNISSLGTRALSSLSGGGKVAHPEVLTILNQVPGFDPQIAQKIANLSPDEIATQLQSAPNMSEDVKNKILAAIGKTPVTPVVKPGGEQMRDLGHAIIKGLEAGPLGNSIGAPLPR